MAPKILAAVITLLLNVSAGVIVFFAMLLGMNGFSESDANYGIVAYIILAVAVSITMALLAAVGVHLLMKRDFRAVSAALVSIVVFATLGSVLKVVCSVVGILVADFVRVNF